MSQSTRPHAPGQHKRHENARKAIKWHESGRAVEWQVARWVHWYNHQRLHSSIGDLPPLEFERAYRQAQPVTPIPDVA